MRSRFAGWRACSREHLPGHALRGQGPGAGLDRPDRQPEDGQADRERAIPRRALGSREAAGPRAQPPLLGAAPGVSRSAGHPLLPSVRGATAGRGAREPAQRAVDFASCPRHRDRPGRSAAARHHGGFPPNRTAGSTSLSGSARRPSRRFGTSSSAGARVRDRPPGSSGRSSANRRRTSRQSAVHLTPSRYDGRTGAGTATARPRPAACSSSAGCRRGRDGIYSCGGRAALVALRDDRRGPAASAGARAHHRRSSGSVGIEVVTGVRTPAELLGQILPRATSTSSLSAWSVGAASAATTSTAAAGV